LVLTMMQILRHALVGLTGAPNDHKLLIFAGAVIGFIWLIARADKLAVQRSAGQKQKFP
jgi:hypothetical protein